MTPLPSLPTRHRVVAIKFFTDRFRQLTLKDIVRLRGDVFMVFLIPTNVPRKIKNIYNFQAITMFLNFCQQVYIPLRPFYPSLLEPVSIAVG